MTKLDLALAYLERGFCVIPLWPKSKQAMVRWTEYQARRPTEGEVREWWANEPEANIGIITGAISGIIVADVEGEKKGAKKGDPKPYIGTTSYVVQTPSGGFHFYYAHPGGRVQKGSPTPGVDRQSDGGYVVAAGSTVKTQDYEGEYHLLEDGALGATAPLCLYSGEPASGSVDPVGPPADAWVSRTLVEGCPPGTRNQTLARLSGYLAGKAIPEDVAAAALVPWVLRQAGTHVTPEEAARTVQSIYAKERRAKPAVPAGTYVVDEFAQQDTKQPLDSMTLADFGVQFYGDEIEWLIPDWLPARTVAFLVSPPGRFKTFLTFDVAISVAGGWPFLGQIPVKNPGPVLVIQQEDDYGDMARRFNRIFGSRAPVLPVPAVDDDMVAGHLAVPAIPPVHICTTRGFTLSLDNLRRLEDLVRKIRPRVVVIDPLYSITSADDFMMHAARDMMPLKRLRDAYDLTFLIAAHTKKGAEVGREGLWGSQFLNAFLETGWQIRDREDGENNQVQLQRHFKSSGIPSRVNLEFLLDDKDGYQVTVSDPEEDDSPQDAVLSFLAKKGTPQISQAIADGTGLSLRVTQNRIKKFKAKGLIVSAPDGYSIPKETLKEVESGGPA